ncbi:Spy/CpxP family protein refolding chaperone [Cupriavidus basilensis]|uniref:Spy/CpxP family protein refolding chaperone n=1 Tax=Cupriavidus basilensis TaxID=68895 RepID=A0ABT6AS86_9BURK|nr:Spy/CpxP family protein refolding chaperone [Cupriavidus basilensis]MDF3835492.1 Spy/CpxP family protein refolding chaperone [Cupriavidus basilensis]
MTQPQALLPRLRTLVSLGVLCAAGAMALPAHALQTGAPALPGPAQPPVPVSLRDALALTPAQTALWQAARAAAREAHAHALELRARLIREGGDPDAADAPASSLRARAEREDRLHDALDKDRRAVRDRWIAFDESLDPGQRKHLRAMPEGARWLGLAPAGPFGPMPPGLFHGAMAEGPGPMTGRRPGPGPMPCAFAAPGPDDVPGAAAPRWQGKRDAQ